jgi:predicted transcriptional regulator of viral defense system
MERTGQSPQAATNTLRRLVDVGLLDRVARGRYVIRPLGLLATSSAREDPTLLAAAIFGKEPHRVAYKSALDYWSLLTRPSHELQVAACRRVRRALKDSELRVIAEPQETIGMGTIRADSGARVSDRERALLESAARLDLVDGIETVAEALVMSGDPRPETIQGYAERLSLGSALRRLGSLAHVLGFTDLASVLRPSTPPSGDIDLDPGHRRAGFKDVHFRDTARGVRWLIDPEELEVVAGS